MTLTQENYYGPEANKKFMSKSQFRSWQQCEAATLAELNHEFIKESTQALLVGGYVDAAIDSPEELEKFKAEHPEILNSRTGELKADFKQAELIVDRIKSDRLFSLITGLAPETKGLVQRQAILVGEIGGVPFRGKADFILSKAACGIIVKEFPETAEAFGWPFCDGAIVDLKTAKDFADSWNSDTRSYDNWISAWGYDGQGAVYTELYRQMTGKSLPFVIVAVTKEKEPDLTAVYIPQEDLDAALRIIEDEAPTYQAVKEGRVAPVRCGKCAYCRSTKKLTGILNYKEV